MESAYNNLLALSKTVSGFYENVYAPVLQTLPWIDDGNGLKTASEKVLGNIVFPAWELCSYKNKPDSDQKTIDYLRDRYNQLDAIYSQMQSELRPLLAKLPPQDRTWENLAAMVPQWKKLSGPNILPKSMHVAVEDSFTPTPTSLHVMTSRRRASPQANPAVKVSTDEDVLGKLMAEKIKALHAKGDSDHQIAVAFGSHGLWLDRGFLDSLR